MHLTLFASKKLITNTSISSQTLMLKPTIFTANKQTAQTPFYY